MKVHVALKLEDQLVQEATGVVDKDDRVKLDHGVDWRRVRALAEPGDVARLTVVVRKAED